MQDSEKSFYARVRMNLAILYLFFTVAFHYMLCNPLDMKVLRVKRSDQFPNLSFKFDCKNRPVGFYADMDHNCQIFHMCDEKGRRIPHTCANETSFNQEFRICDWEYNFDCSLSEKWFYLNDLTYATEMNN